MANGPRKQHLVYIGDLERYAAREVCLGAAEYAADRPELDFVPWPVVSGLDRPARRADVRKADCLIAADADVEKVFGHTRDLLMPYVNVGDHRPNIASVELDDIAVGRMAADHLLVRGYPHLAFVGSDQPWSRLRSRGFTRAARAAGVKSHTFEFPVEVLPTTWSWNSERRRQCLAGLLTGLPKPCGVFAANDVVACFLIVTAREQGWRIPQEIGVLGVDDDPVPNAAAGLSISSIVVPFREMGRQAAALIERLRRRKLTLRRILLPPTRVVVRTSTDAFMVGDPLVRQAQVFIEQRRKNRIRVSELAQACGTTRVTLGQRFRRHLGVRVHDYILRRRMEYAKDLLRVGELNVDEVAQACGFKSAPFFCAVFKRMIGATPGRLRRASRMSG